MEEYVNISAILNYIADNILALIALAISLYSIHYTKRNDRSNLELELAKKRAELRTLNSMPQFCDSTTMNNAIIRREQLKREIHELEKKL